MPEYVYRCADSGVKFTRFLRMAQYKEPQNCICGAHGNRVILSPIISVKETDYTCPITDKHISSRHEHQENLKRHGCRLLEGGEKEQAGKYREQLDQQLDRKIEETVEKHYDVLPGEKREKLANELLDGMDAQVVRG